MHMCIAGDEQGVARRHGATRPRRRAPLQGTCTLAPRRAWPGSPYSGFSSITRSRSRWNFWQSCGAPAGAGAARTALREGRCRGVVARQGHRQAGSGPCASGAAVARSLPCRREGCGSRTQGRRKAGRGAAQPQTHRPQVLSLLQRDLTGVLLVHRQHTRCRRGQASKAALWVAGRWGGGGNRLVAGRAARQLARAGPEGLRFALPHPGRTPRPPVGAAGAEVLRAEAVRLSRAA